MAVIPNRAPIREFGADAARASAALERGVDDVARTLGTGKAPRWLVLRAVTATRATAQGRAYAAAPWELVRLDPRGGAFTVALPELRGPDAGTALYLQNITSSATTITIRGAAGTLINGAATATIAAAHGSKVVTWDGEAWWSRA